LRSGIAKSEAHRVNRYVRDYGLAIVLAVLFVVSWVGQTLSGWVEYVAEQESHAEAAELFGPSGYVWRWLEATMENWQSEFLQLFTMVVLTAFLIHKGSSESKDSDDEMLLQLTAIRRELAELKGSGK
jgi:hypothetical protein